MLSRFSVALDPAVDRYIIRDADSRLNSRDSFAVQEWIESGMKLHSMRDHISHCHPFHGGMWGGVKNALPNFHLNLNSGLQDFDSFKYLKDMNILEALWSDVKVSTALVY